MIVRTLALLLGLLGAVAPGAALEIERRTVELRYVDPPTAAPGGLDLDGVQAELAIGETTYGKPEVRLTRSLCAPGPGAREQTEHVTHFLEIPYHSGEAVLVVRAKGGRVIHTARIPALGSSEWFGYDQCEYVETEPLIEDFRLVLGRFHRTVEEGLHRHFVEQAEQALNAALFFNVRKSGIPVYRFTDPRHDYTDLNAAAELAENGYAALNRNLGLGHEGRAQLAEAVDLWQAALAGSDLDNENARIDHRVTVRLHESIGAAAGVLGQRTMALSHLARAMRLENMVTSRGDGSGTSDLLQRARSGKDQPATLHAPHGVDALIAETDAFRGKLPVKVRTEDHLARLEAEHLAFSATLPARGEWPRENPTATAAATRDPETIVEQAPLPEQD